MALPNTRESQESHIGLPPNRKQPFSPHLAPSTFRHCYGWDSWRMKSLTSGRLLRGPRSSQHPLKPPPHPLCDGFGWFRWLMLKNCTHILQPGGSREVATLRNACSEFPGSSPTPIIIKRLPSSLGSTLVLHQTHTLSRFAPSHFGGRAKHLAEMATMFCVSAAPLKRV